MSWIAIHSANPQGQVTPTELQRTGEDPLYDAIKAAYDSAEAGLTSVLGATEGFVSSKGTEAELRVARNKIMTLMAAITTKAKEIKNAAEQAYINKAETLLDEGPEES